VVQRFVNLENISVGKRAVILGSGDIGLIMARRLTLSGTEVVCVLEKQPYCGGLPRNKYQCLDDYGIPLCLGNTVMDICGADHLTGVVAAPLDEMGRPVPGEEYEIPCDALVLSVGLIPENELALLAGLVLLPETGVLSVDAHLETSAQGFFACGNAMQVNDLVDNVSEEGARAGTWAAKFALEGITREIAVLVEKGEGIRYVAPQRVFAGEKAVLSFRGTSLGEGKTLRVTATGGAESGVVLCETSRARVNPAEMLQITVDVPPDISGAIRVEAL
jgi:NADPH-dependent 2,4-dienoyl-CoA reductase/sulfur reductase-like enzyme